LFLLNVEGFAGETAAYAANVEANSYRLWT
jgi:hypothetical protein